MSNPDPLGSSKGIALIIASIPEDKSPGDSVIDEMLEGAYQQDFGSMYHSTITEDELSWLYTCVCFTRAGLRMDNPDRNELSKLIHKISNITEVYNEQ